MPRGSGFCFVFSTRGPEFRTEKLSAGRGFWRKKFVARELAGGGGGEMVTNQSDTRISGPWYSQMRFKFPGINHVV